MLARQHRLTRSQDFRAAFARGRTFVNRLLVLKVLRRPEEQPARFGFSASAKFGKAVVRNRAKRLISEAVRLLGEDVKQTGFDAVLIARPPVREASMAEVSQAVQDLLRRSNLLKSHGQAEEQPLE